MRNVAIFVAGTVLSGLFVFVGCSSSSSTGTGVGGGTSGSSSSSSTASSSGSSSSASSSSSTGAGGGAANFTCTVPSPAPSKGSCVTFTAPPDGGPELDAGLDDAGNAAITVCNPITNAGCTGTDTCTSDSSGVNFFCAPAGSPADVPLCGNCTAQAATCAAGGICLSLDQPSLPCQSNTDCPKTTPICDTTMSQCVDFWCGALCCTDADCGAGMTCDVNDLMLGAKMNVGFCVPM